MIVQEYKKGKNRKWTKKEKRKKVKVKKGSKRNVKKERIGGEIEAADCDIIRWPRELNLSSGGKFHT